MMWEASLILFCYFVAQVTSKEIIVECRRESRDFPPCSNTTPSVLADLRVDRVTVGEKNMMNISWAINIDASNKYLTDTRIFIMGEAAIYCKYNPVLSEAGIRGSVQKWFHYLVEASYGFNSIQAANMPLPLTESVISYKFFTITIPRPTQRVTRKPTAVPTAEVPTSEGADPGNVNFTSIALAVLGVLVGLMIMSSCYVIYKQYGTNVASSLGFKRLPTSLMAPVPVLLVYPAEDSAFQQAVVALTEFLQWYGGCSVAVDMWQQRKIAELGPMRWLAEKAKNAQRVLIICPKSSSLPSHSLPNHAFPEPSIPASAHDLYPLILNMVAGHAKRGSDLAKFCVVQLCEERDKKSSNLALELRSCKSFRLMKDLNKLCRSLHAESQDDKKVSDLIFRPRISCSEKCSVKLREAVEKLGGHQPNISRIAKPLTSVVTIV